ncbi:transcriptional regulator, GntR family [Fulvimarina manganoxydans]|uniref:Transcriptional regulator, GntR family n=1 Tax=Fulvimarina manganoxydans TaxID=937218 RepID=A0A1W2AFT4_9HYPH|nr:FadR/GntR family transcriptional regulator [Fulvimarina manganoxydans]SMC59108.1 transcriptional regulator, GntR family [Fulvimarina manganoxydans]
MTGLLRALAPEAASRTSHAHVVASLGRQIVSGYFPPGTILPGDKDLGERFGVSRTVLREAMKTLAAKRLIEAKTRVGTKVLEPERWNLLDSDVLRWRVETGLDKGFIEDLAAMRLAFEPEAAALAARRATAEDIARLHAIVDELGDLGHDRASIAYVDLDFHIAIADTSRNPFMRATSGLIEAALSIALRLSSPADNPELITDLAKSHRRIVDAIESGDEDNARRAMRDVIELGATRTQQALGKE